MLRLRAGTRHRSAGGQCRQLLIVEAFADGDADRRVGVPVGPDDRGQQGQRDGGQDRDGEFSPVAVGGEPGQPDRAVGLGKGPPRLPEHRLPGPAEQTGGAFSLTDNLVRRGNASPIHVHDHEDETLFVLDGELRVLVGEDDYTAGPGTVAVLPRLLRHAYVVTSATARFLTLHVPAGFEQFAAEVGQPARALTLPRSPQGHPTSPRWVS